MFVEQQFMKDDDYLFYLCTAADTPTDLTAEKLPQEPGSFRVSWTPPASSANLTGYRMYYSGADDSGSMDVGASATNITIGSRTAGVTYSITMVALSPHLPSPVVGPVRVKMGEKNLHTLCMVQCCYSFAMLIVLLKLVAPIVVVTVGKVAKDVMNFI